MAGGGGLDDTIVGLQRLRAQSPQAFAEIARTLDTKVQELLTVCRTVEARLRESGDTEAADLLAVMVLEWETTIDVPALTFPFLLERDEPD
jgi:hypothetical protein